MVAGPVAMSMGLEDPLIGSITVGIALIVLGICILVGAILWASRAGELRDVGKVLVSIPLALMLVLVLVMAIEPAEVTPPTTHDATFEVLSVGGTVSCNYTSSTHVITVYQRVNSTANTITSPKSMSVNFTVQRTDSGETTDIKTVTASIAPASLTDPVTGLSYSSILPNGFGQPSCNWTMTVGSSANVAQFSLSAQMGLTPYQTGSFNMTIWWNPSAMTTSNVALNTIIPAGSMVVSGETYTIQVLLTGVDT
jgi:hypothetical protein